MSTTTLRPKTKAVLAVKDTGDGINHNWSVTNSSSQELVILDLYNDGKSTKELVYEQGITQLNTSDGKSSIAAAASTDAPTQVTIGLNDIHNTVTATLYQIVFANPKNLFPVKSTSVGLSYNSDPAVFTAQSIASADPKYMIDAANFVRTIAANPSSALATGFTQAVQDATASSKTAAAIDAAIATWLKNNTVSFQNVTLEGVAAIHSYFSVFPYEYMDYNVSKDYYLYSSDGTTLTYQGWLGLKNTNDPSKTAGIDKSLKGFTFVHTTADGKIATTLMYYKGQFVDNQDMPNICLSGVSMVKSMLTNVDTDTDLISVVSGVVYGHKVIGYFEEQHIPDPSNPDDKWSGVYGLLHPTNAMGIINLAMILAGLSGFVKDLVIAPLKGLKDLLTKKKIEKKGQEPTDSEVDDLRNQITDLKSQWQLETQALIDKMQSDVDTNKELLVEQKRFNDELIDTLNEMKRQSMLDELDGDNAALEAAAEYQNTDDMQNASFGIFEEVRIVKKIPADKLAEQLIIEEANVIQLSTDATNAADAAVDGAGTEVTEAVEAGKEASKDAFEQREVIDEQRKKAEEGKADEGESESKPIEGADD